jgi:hypothetical protein
VPLNEAECLGMHQISTKSIIVICANADKNIIFVHGIIT